MLQFTSLVHTSTLPQVCSTSLVVYKVVPFNRCRHPIVVLVPLSEMPFKVDEFTTKLMTGDRGCSDTWGLNINLASPPPVDLVTAYEPFALRLSDAMKGTGAYVYPSFSLHITTASPAPFTNCHISLAERDSLRSAWADALRAVSQDPSWPSAPFPLIYERVTLETAAAIAWVSDPTGAVARIRALIQRAFESEAVQSLPNGLALRSRHRIPDIIHTSVLRFGAEPGPGRDEASIRAAFDSVASTWQPVTVMCDALRLVEEAALYMHLHLDGEDAGRVALTLPFAQHT